MRLLRRVRRFVSEEQGATAVEYSVMIALILLVVIAGVTATGGGVSGWWNNIDSELDTHGF